MLGVLLDGGSQFFHRGGGFFQVRRLLLGAARQVVVAGGDLASGGVDADRRGLDAADDGGQLLGGGIGVVAHGGEHAIELAVHACGQVAVRQRGQQLGDFADAVAVGLQQAVELLRQLQEEALLAVGGHASGQVAGCGGLHDLGHFLFDLGLDGAVARFADEADMVAVRVADVGHDLRDAGMAVSHLALDDALFLDRGHGAGVDLVAVFQHRQRGADQRHARIECGGDLVDVVSVLVDDALHRRVRIDDGVVQVGDEHAGGGVVQRSADAQVLGRHRRVALGALAQVLLHALERLHQFADLVLAAGVDVPVELAAGDLVGDLDRAAHVAGQHAPEQPGQAYGADHADHHAHQQQGRGPTVGGVGDHCGDLRLAVVLADQRDHVVHDLVVQGAGLAGEGVDRIVVQFQLQHLVHRLVGGDGLLPVRRGALVDRALLRGADRRRILGDDLVHPLLQRHLARFGVFLDRLAAADQALVGRAAVFAEDAAHLAAGAHAGHHLVGSIVGHVVDRMQAVVGDQSLDQHDGEHETERQHQLRHQLQIFYPLHERISPWFDNGGEASEKQKRRLAGAHGLRRGDASSSYLIVASFRLDGALTWISARELSRSILPITHTSLPSRLSGAKPNLPRSAPAMRAEKVWRGNMPPMYRNVGSPSEFCAYLAFSTLPQTMPSLPTKRAAISGGIICCDWAKALGLAASSRISSKGKFGFTEKLL